MRLSLRQRITMLSVGLVAAALLLLTAVVSRTESDAARKFYRDECLGSNEALAHKLSSDLPFDERGRAGERGAMECLLREWIEGNKLDVSALLIFGADGNIIFQSDSTALRVLGEDAASLEWKSTGKASARVRKASSFGPVLEVSTPLVLPDSSRGWIVAGYSLEPVNSELNTILLHHLLSALVIFITSAIILTLYLHRTFKPLIELRDFVNRAASESWLRSSIKRNDEIGDLARTFNFMLDEMEHGRELERETQEKFHQTEKMSTIGKLAAGVAHEVRNPLAGILNLVENLERYDVEPGRRREYIELIHEGLRRIEKTVDGLVSFARQSTSSRWMTDPCQLIENALALAAYPIKKGGVKVIRQFENDIPKIHVDADQIHQVLLNIILNALQAMEDAGGTLRLGVTRRDDRYIALFVEDTGIGIPEGNISRIFDPFFTTQPAGLGTGLGLAVSRNIVHSHGGKIEVRSEEGKGARFTVLFPIGKEEITERQGSEEEKGSD